VATVATTSAAPTPRAAPSPLSYPLYEPERRRLQKDLLTERQNHDRTFELLHQERIAREAAEQQACAVDAECKKLLEASKQAEQRISPWKDKVIKLREEIAQHTNHISELKQASAAAQVARAACERQLLALRAELDAAPAAAVEGAARAAEAAATAATAAARKLAAAASAKATANWKRELEAAVARAREESATDGSRGMLRLRDELSCAKRARDAAREEVERLDGACRAALELNEQQCGLLLATRTQLGMAKSQLDGFVRVSSASRLSSASRGNGSKGCGRRRAINGHALGPHRCTFTFPVCHASGYGGSPPAAAPSSAAR